VLSLLRQNGVLALRSATFYIKRSLTEKDTGGSAEGGQQLSCWSIPGIIESSFWRGLIEQMFANQLLCKSRESI
jgi:hypothetical protein